MAPASDLDVRSVQENYAQCERRRAEELLDEQMPPPALTGPAAKSRGRLSPGPAPLPPPPDATAVVAVFGVYTPRSAPSPPTAQPAARRRCLEPNLEAAAAAAERAALVSALAPAAATATAAAAAATGMSEAGSPFAVQLG